MSTGLYSDNVKKFIERNISYIEEGKLFDIFMFAYESLDPYECNVLADILSHVMDDFESLRKRALITLIGHKLTCFKLRKDKVDNISILAFIHMFLPSTFNLPEGEVMQLILDNRSKWPKQIKYDPSLNNWRVFK